MPCTLFGGLACAVPCCGPCCCPGAVALPSCGCACPAFGAGGCCCAPMPICNAPAPCCCPLPCLPAVCLASYFFWKQHDDDNHPDDQVDTGSFNSKYMPIDDTRPFRLDESRGYSPQQRHFDNVHNHYHPGKRENNGASAATTAVAYTTTSRARTVVPIDKH